MPTNIWQEFNRYKPLVLVLIGIITSRAVMCSRRGGSAFDPCERWLNYRCLCCPHCLRRFGCQGPVDSIRDSVNGRRMQVGVWGAVCVTDINASAVHVLLQMGQQFIKLHATHNAQLFIHPSKCKVLHFGNNNKEFSYVMGSHTLNVVSEEKDLGVCITNNLKAARQLVLLRSSPPTSPPRWIASTASPPPPRWQLMFLTVGVQLEHL